MHFFWSFFLFSFAGFIWKRLEATEFYLLFSFVATSRCDDCAFLFFLSGKLARYYAAKVLRSPTVGITDGDDGSGRLLLGAKSSTNARNSWTGHTLLLGLFFSLFVLYGYICRERAFLCGG